MSIINKSFLLLGDIVTMKITGDETGGSYCVMQIEVSPNNGPPPHKHSREDEGFYIVEGKFSFTYGDTETQATNGMFIHLPRGEFHTYRNVSNTYGRLIVVATPAGFEHFFEEAGIFVDNNSSFTPSQDIPTSESHILGIAAKYGLQLK